METPTTLDRTVRMAPWRGRAVRAVVSGVADDPAWDAFVASTPGGHHVQTGTWGRVKADAGWETVRLSVLDDRRIIAGGQVLTRRIGGVTRVGFMDRAPLGVSGDVPLVRLVLDALDDLVRMLRVHLLIVQPPEGDRWLPTVLATRGFGTSHVKTSLGATVLVDLEPEPDDILAGMKSKTRYNIRKGMRSDVSIRLGGEADVDAFHAMLADTARRQGFTPMSLSQLRLMWRLMTPTDTFELLMADVDDRPVAGILTVPFGDRVIYKRGAWSGRHGDARPNERLHWEAMLRARHRGHRYYDFDGIERHVAEAVLAGEPLPSDAVESVTRFKLGFGDAVLLPPAHSYLYNRGIRWAHDVVYPRVAHTRPAKRAARRLRSS